MGRVSSPSPPLPIHQRGGAEPAQRGELDQYPSTADAPVRAYCAAGPTCGAARVLSAFPGAVQEQLDSRCKYCFLCARRKLSGCAAPIRHVGGPRLN